MKFEICLWQPSFAVTLILEITIMARVANQRVQVQLPFSVTKSQKVSEITKSVRY